MPLPTGTKLGPYEITAVLGAGGMGEVYKARDTRLDRTVAIKVSKTGFTERFEREAQAVAALNHPHICTLHDVGPNYLVMEYIEGKVLKGPMPVDEVLKYASQICDALATAHKKGITHRDLKPANILVTKAGIKLLDFGLAKIGQDAAPASDATLTMSLTGKNEIVGTLYYMSPEQLQAGGQEIDARTDIFSFGLVVYEMLTGKRAFEGSSPATVMAAIIERPAPSFADVAPAALDRVLKRCLAKDPDERWQTTRDLKAELDWIQAEPVATPVAAPSARPIARWLWLAATAGVIILAFVAWMVWPKPEPPARVVRFELPLPEKVDFRGYVSVSPDGRKLVIAGAGDQSGLWIRNLDSVAWRNLPDTQGAVGPFWSPDSRFLAFAIGNQLRKIDVTGGPPQTLCQVEGPVASGAWSPKGTIIFGVGRGDGHLWRVPEAGGIATALTALDAAQGERFHALPSFLPDGNHFLHLRGPLGGIYVGSLDAKPAEQSHQRLLATPVAASYADGYLFFLRENTVMAQSFDTSRLQLKGEPVPIVEHVTVTATIVGGFSVSPSGVLAFRAGASQNFQPTWFDRQGNILSAVGQPGPYQDFALSSDGTRAAYRDASGTQAGDIWTLDLAREVSTRLTFRPSEGSFPVWSSDGSRIAYSAGGAQDTLFEKPSSGAGDEKELYKNPGQIMNPTSWSRDGRYLLYYTVNSPKTGADLWILPHEGDHKPVLLLGTEYYEGEGVFSPDGHWIAYTSSESGHNQIYVRPFVAPGPSATPALGAGKWQISKNGGTQPHWRADGKEIFFIENATLFAVDIQTSGSALEPGAPQQLFRARNAGWDVSADGKRFLMAVPPVQQNAAVPITLVLNWQAALKH